MKNLNRRNFLINSSLVTGGGLLDLDAGNEKRIRMKIQKQCLR